MPEIPLSWKRRVARLVRIPLLHQLMIWGVRLTVPRQRIGVAMIAIDEKERVLMLRHVFHPHTPWGVPGGWLNRNESPAAGVLRELKEETGLTAELGPVVHITYDPKPSHIGIAFLGHVQPGPMTLSSEIIEAAWFPIDALPGPLLPFIGDALKTAIVVHQTLSALP